ncbi:probable serine/threonine-protein kinase DDB_G0271402 [Tetranychus urticae]|uniref:Uncharacterized protein n=1 Tax=Tetranychus urticae TaxID=32264 RepID=T1JUL5_TETUR|nr:probable serine/threonine-protein kinase DDB_G0271402 [Tetranychus urticae]XP_025018538.1 probable serine/threonine-protein kinase DDB_G0271402 [Tetranychus urticae]
MFKWISSIQNAIKDARVNRKGPGRRRQDKSKHGGNHTVDGSRHKTAPPETIKFDTDRVEPVSILHCEQKNRPRGPTGRRAPGRAFLHSTILGGSSVGNLINSSTGDLLAITETNSLESSTEMTGSMDSSDNLEQKHNNNHHQMYNHHNHHRPRTMTTETVDTDADDYEEERDSKTENEEDNHYDTIVNESNRRIIGIMNKMRLEGEEKIKMSNGFGKGDASHDNHGDKQANLISKSNESNGTSNHFHANIARLNGKHTNGYSSSSPPINKTITATSPSIKRRFHEDTKDLKKHLNAIFSNNNQQNQQLMVNLGDSTVSIEQTKLTECLKEICPTLTSGSLLSEGSSVKTSLTDLDPNLRSLIKELEALKGVKKSKVRSEKIQSLVDKLVNLVDTYSKNVESFENYNDQIIKLISSLSTLVSQPTPMVTSSSTSSPSSSPRLVNANKLHYKPVNSPSSTHC